MPIGRSWWALVAGYLGIMSIIPVFAPFAIATGVMAIRDIQQYPEKKGLGRAWFGIIMGVIFGAIGLIILVAR